MARLLVLVIVVFLVYRLLKFVLEPPGGAVRGRPPGAAPRAPGNGPPAAGPERLVEDPVCGVRIPESRAIRVGDVYFCSEECRSRHHS